jgi:transcriptional regulator with XRE-family HTH domain
MKVTRWKDLKHKASPARRAEIRREVENEILEENLKGVRALTGKTQADIAAALELHQGRVSDFENREDHLLSTLRRYIEALGGELEVRAVFGDKTVRLKDV